METINLNSLIKVKLSERGAKIYNKYDQNILNFLQSLTLNEKYVNNHKEMFKTDYKEGEEIEKSLWELMQIFGGENMAMGEPVPFIKNEIEIIKMC